jgi:hypothetical protein
MSKYKETIYLNGEYTVVNPSYINENKYITNPKFILEETADVVFGKKWLGKYPKSFDFDKNPIIVNFLARMSAQGMENFKDETIVYGKIYETLSRFGINELFLLKELEFQKSIKELNILLTKSKIKIKKL